MDLLDYASKKVKDTASFLNFLKAVVTGGDPELRDKQIAAVLKARKPPRLSKQQYLDLLHHCVLCELLPQPILRLAAAKDVTAAELWQLIQLCLMDRRPDPPPCDDDSDSDDEDYELPEGPKLGVVRDLLELPAASKLTTDQLLQVLQLALQTGCGWSSDGVVCRILAPPAAGQIGAAGAQELLLAAFDHGALAAVDSLCQRLPACAAAWEALDPAVLQQHIESTVKDSKAGGFTAIHSLLQHPRMQQYAAEVLLSVLLAGFKRNRGCVYDVWGRYGLPRKPLAWAFDAGPTVDELRSLLCLPAAGSLSAAVVQQLMRTSIERMAGALLPELVRLPGAAQISDGDLAALLRLAWTDSSKAKSAPLAAAAAAAPAVRAAGSGVVLQEPDATQPSRTTRQTAAMGQQQQQEGLKRNRGKQQQQPQPGQQPASGLVDLALDCLQQPRGAVMLFPLLQLPWAQRLPAAVVRCLLQAAAERQAKSTFDRLMQLPRAPRDDAEVRGYADMVRFCGGDGHLCDFAPADEFVDEERFSEYSSVGPSDEGSEQSGSDDEGSSGGSSGSGSGGVPPGPGLAQMPGGAHPVFEDTIPAAHLHQWANDDVDSESESESSDSY